MISSFVDDILTYSKANERTAKSVREKLLPRLLEEGITNTSEVYRIVTNWIDTVNSPSQEKYGMRLDKPFDDGTTRAFVDTHSKTPLEILLEKEEKMLEDGPLDLGKITKSFAGKRIIFPTQAVVFSNERYPVILKEERSTVYPRIVISKEQKLRKAIAMNLNIREAGSYAEVDASVVRGFWRKIGYDYLTEEQKTRILEGIDKGFSRLQIVTNANLSNINDLTYFCKANGIKLNGKKSNISVFSERRLKEAASQNMSLQEASKYANVDENLIVGFWKKMGYIGNEVSHVDKQDKKDVIKEIVDAVKEITETTQQPVTIREIMQKGMGTEYDTTRIRLESAVRSGLLSKHLGVGKNKSGKRIFYNPVYEHAN